MTPHPDVPVPLRIVVADDQASVRQGLVVLLGTLPEIEVVASAANGEEAIRLVAEKNPHAILLDLHMPVLDGIEATRRLTEQHPDVAVVVLTTYVDDSSVAGRAGSRRPQLSHQGRRLRRHRPGAAQRGDRSVGHRSRRPRRTARRREVTTGETARAEASRSPDGLTLREGEILSMMARGMTNPDIAAELYISAQTIKSHINRIFAKTGSANRTAAIRYARDHHLG